MAFQSQADVTAFAESANGGQKILWFIRKLGSVRSHFDAHFNLQSVQGFPTMHISSIDHENIRSYQRVLAKIEALCDKVEPVKDDANQRFGNRAFRVFMSELQQHCSDWLVELKGSTDPDFHDVMCGFLCESFGNPTRIDYGTGHELNFLASIIVLCGDEDISPEFGRQLVFGLFMQYLRLVRKVQQRYRLEPAGSRGVWGLDDYQFVPFIWGAYQLCGNRQSPPPKDSVIRASVSAHRDDLLYFNMIWHIMSCRGESTPFHHTNPMLYDISGIESWERIREGLERMFYKEVLLAYPVMQHFPLVKHFC